MARSKTISNMFDPSTRFMSGRWKMVNGSNLSIPSILTTNTCTGKPMPGRYPFAPHDMKGLMALYGGPKGF